MDAESESDSDSEADFDEDNEDFLRTLDPKMWKVGGVAPSNNGHFPDILSSYSVILLFSNVMIFIYHF